MGEKQKIWHSVKIEIGTEAEEAVVFALNELDSLGTEIIDFRKNRNDNLHIIGYFANEIDDARLRGKLNECLKIYNLSADSVKKFNWNEVENQDWLAEWKKHWRPTETAKFIVAPTWTEIENTEKIIIRVEPGMAFGTGTHETTRLCLRAIEENYSPEMSFLDVGTGTGILAVGAAKMRVRDLKSEIQSSNPVAACDTDADAVEIARENALINNTGEIFFYVGSISDETPAFDFVCANLTADVIVPLLPLLIGKSGKILILSGILKEQEDLIVSELKKLKAENPKIETDGEWISVQVKTEN